MSKIQHLPLIDLDNVNHRRRQREVTNSILKFEHDDSRIQTAAEKLAGVTPVNYAYAPGDVRRYGASTASADNTASFQAAVYQFAQTGSAGYIPSGTWMCTGTVTGTRGMQWYGDGRFVSIVSYTGSGNWYTFTGTIGDPDGGAHEFRDFTAKGSSSSGNLIEITTAGQNTFVGMRFWLSGTSLVVLSTECHNTHFRNCMFRSWVTGAVYCTGLNSIISVQGCEFSILGGDGITQAVGSSCIFFDDGEQLTIADNNVNGDSTLYHFIRVIGDIGRLYVGENYDEHLVGSNIKVDYGLVVSGAVIHNNQVSCADSIAYDFSTGNPAHTGIFIRNIRRPETGAVFIFGPGSGIVDFDYSGVPLDGSADHVVGYAGMRAVKKYQDGRIEQNGNPSTAVTTLATYTFAFTHILQAAEIFNSSNSPAQITANQNDYTAGGAILTKIVHRLSSDASRDITGLDRDGNGHVRAIINIGAQNIVLIHASGSSAANKRFSLPGAASYTITPGAAVWLWYDTVSDLWRLLSGTA